MKSFNEFLQQFKFDSRKRLMIGVERECHLKNKNGQIAPIAKKILDCLGNKDGQFGYELSACQLEWRIGPCGLSELKEKLLADEIILRETEKQLGFTRSFIEVGPGDMPLDVYPDPTRRYQRIAENLPRHILLAACQVIATHIHIGMPDYQSALMVYNSVINYIDGLCRLGDHSDGKRLELYKIMAPNFVPLLYNTWQDFYEKAVKEDFIDDPRKCWTLIRMSIHGTIEFRMFGATGNLDEIVGWAKKCQEICKQALENK